LSAELTTNRDTLIDQSYNYNYNIQCYGTTTTQDYVNTTKWNKLFANKMHAYYWKPLITILKSLTKQQNKMYILQSMGDNQGLQWKNKCCCWNRQGCRSTVVY